MFPFEHFPRVMTHFRVIVMQVLMAQISDQCWPADVKPVVSVMCFTYNHERFIAQCLDAILCQVTDFPVELLVHDDASTDGSPGIIRTYAQRFPNIVKPVLQTENQHSLHRKIRPILQRRAKGCFVANCDGDDVWLDPCKLARQVGFLRGNPEYVLSYHDAVTINGEGHVIKSTYIPDVFRRDYSQAELKELKWGWMLEGTVVYRNVKVDFPPEYDMAPNGDNFFPILLAAHGAAKFQADVGPLAYRHHAGGMWSSKTPAEQTRMHLQTYLQIANYFVRTGETETAKKIIAGRLSHYASEYFAHHPDAASPAR